MNANRRKRRTNIHFRNIRFLRDYYNRRGRLNQIRGEKAPQYFLNTRYGDEEILSNLEGFLSTKGYYIIDASGLQISLLSRFNGNVFKDYLELSSYAGQEEYRPALEKLLRLMNKYSETWARIIPKDNIFVLPEVKCEVAAYQRKLKKNTKNIRQRNIREEILRPVSAIINFLCENSGRLEESGLLDDPVITRVIDLLDYDSKVHSAPLSNTDKMIIGFSIAHGITNGGSQVILTGDAAIEKALANFYKDIKSGRKRLDLSDLVETPENFRVYALVPRSLPKPCLVKIPYIDSTKIF